MADARMLLAESYLRTEDVAKAVVSGESWQICRQNTLTNLPPLILPERSLSFMQNRINPRAYQHLSTTDQ